MQGKTQEAFTMLDEVKRISPINAYEVQQRAEAYYVDGKYDEAINVYKEGLLTFPHVYALYDGLGRVYVFKGKYLDAINSLNEGLSHSTLRPPSTLAYLAIAHYKTGDTKKSNELILELNERAARGEKGINIFIAIYYSAINSKEQAFNYLDRAFNTNDVDLIWLKVEPSFKNLHADPRYNSYLNRIGF